VTRPAAPLPDLAVRLRQLADQVDTLAPAELVGRLQALCRLVLSGPRRPNGSGSLYLRRRTWWACVWRHGRQFRCSTRCRVEERDQAEAFLARLRGADPAAPPDAGAWRLTGIEVRLLRGPVVYVLKRGGRVLYVGQSRHGLARPLATRHHILGHLAFDGREDLFVYPCESAAAAMAMEAELILRMAPQLNTRVARLAQASAPQLDIRNPKGLAGPSHEHEAHGTPSDVPAPNGGASLPRRSGTPGRHGVCAPGARPAGGLDSPGGGGGRHA
jgi:hypothetical protein